MIRSSRIFDGIKLFHEQRVRRPKAREIVVVVRRDPKSRLVMIWRRARFHIFVSQHPLNF